MRLLLLLALTCLAHFATAAQLSIIIDDIGYRHTDKAVLSLPNTITLAVLPHTPLGEKIAKEASEQGNEIMLHLPMQALDGRKLGPGGLTNQMSEQEFKLIITDALNSIPNVRGVNNHMGSLLTQLPEPMRWLMEILKGHDSYFVDSFTTRYSKAAEIAEEQGIPLLRRAVFLDNNVDSKALEKQFQQAIDLAKEQGHAIMIAHTYPESISFLTQNLERLETNGVNLVKVSEQLPYQLAKKTDDTKIM